MNNHITDKTQKDLEREEADFYSWWEKEHDDYDARREQALEDKYNITKQDSL